MQVTCLQTPPLQQPGLLPQLQGLRSYPAAAASAAAHGPGWLCGEQGARAASRQLPDMPQLRCVRRRSCWAPGQRCLVGHPSHLCGTPEPSARNRMPRWVDDQATRSCAEGQQLHDREQGVKILLRKQGRLGLHGPRVKCTWAGKGGRSARLPLQLQQLCVTPCSLM